VLFLYDSNTVRKSDGEGPRPRRGQVIRFFGSGDDDEKMAKSFFNKVLLEQDFVLEPSNEIKNQSLVSYQNLIYNLNVEARTSHYFFF